MATFPNVSQQYESWLNHLSDIPNNMDLKVSQKSGRTPLDNRKTN
jgi:hypothetical protein